MLYPINRNNKYGFINEKGEVIIKPIFKYVKDFSKWFKENDLLTNEGIDVYKDKNN